MNPVILILDPSLVGRTIAKTACDQLQFTAFSVDGESAIAMVQEINPDIVIFDCNLGEIDVEDFSKEISKLSLERYPAILVTGEVSQSTYVQQYYQRAPLASEYLLKPFEIQTLRAVLANMIDSVSRSKRQFPDAELRRRITILRKAESIQMRNPTVQGHLDLAQEFLEIRMEKDASRHYHAAALLEIPSTSVPLLSGVLKPNHRLHTVLQTITAQRWTGNLVLESGFCLSSSYIYFEEGSILDANGGGLTGKECIEFYLGCTRGEYKFFEMPIFQENNINQSTEELLLEFAANWDESVNITMDPSDVAAMASEAKWMQRQAD